MAYTLTYSFSNNAYALSGYSGTPDNVIIPSTYNDGEHGLHIVNKISGNAFYNCSSLASIVIPDSVMSIEGSAFSGCGSLTSITIGNSVTSIESNAFRDCSSLTSIYYTGTIDSWCEIGGLNNLMRYGSSNKNLYINNELVTTVNITTATKINNYAFYNCSSLEVVTIGDSVTSIGIWAFSGCNSLISVTIGNNATSIGDNAFYLCGSLISVTIGNSVTSIENGAFGGCSSLTNITIGSGVTSIGYLAFYYCSSLTSINVLAKNPPTLGASVFLNTPLESICVPAKSVDTYKEAWPDHANIIFALPKRGVKVNNKVLSNVNEHLIGGFNGFDIVPGRMLFIPPIPRNDDLLVVSSNDVIQDGTNLTLI